MKPSSAKASRLKGKYKQSKTPFEYLMQRVAIPLDDRDPCWVFTGPLDKNGYGQCHASKVAKDVGVTRAHQLAWVMMNGPIEKGMMVCHKCDNPPCCNPQHLFLGTAQDNNDDMWAKGRWVSGAKTRYDRDYINSQHGIKDCFQLSEELGCSYSLICHVWRKSGKTGKRWHKGNKCVQP